MIGQKLIDSLKQIVGPGGVVHVPADLLVYECDGYTIEKAVPEAVVLPASAEETAQVVRLLVRERVPYIPRGAGTSLSGGTLAVEGSVVIGLTRMNRVLDVDIRNRRATVESGLVNLWLSNEVSPQGYFFAPDPSSQMACTIGGNVAENSGGPHTLKYGVTTNHVLAVEVVLPDGEKVWLGGSAEDHPGYDLTGLFVGSEGTLGIATKAVVRLVRKPQAFKTFLAVFETVDDATSAVSGIIAAGIVPAALEMMDQKIIRAVEAAFHFGFPQDAGAVLIIELDGLAAGMEEDSQRVLEVCRSCRARETRVARDDAERTALWASRKKAFGAIGRLSPSYCTQDGVVPRTKLPDILRKTRAIGEKYNIEIANVFHAGDGNIHPILLFDERDREQMRRVLQASAEILEACVEMGGTITGEHGIGIEKINQMSLIFSPEDLKLMESLRDVFNPDGLCNPLKIFPTSRTCAVDGVLRRHAAT
ncbi:MAG: FAD-binding protein [Armatimonadetes bacterium]|nr:FAD-binding protein [Armatimonadota bacterium]